MNSSLRCFALLLLPLLVCLGCQQRPEMGQVSGTVTNKQGQPMEGISVYFFPDQAAGNARKSIGITDASGVYKLVYQDDRTESGAVVGNHVIVLEDTAAENSRESPLRNRIPLRYYAATHTPLRYRVKAGEQTFDIKVE